MRNSPTWKKNRETPGWDPVGWTFLVCEFRTLLSSWKHLLVSVWLGWRTGSPEVCSGQSEGSSIITTLEAPTRRSSPRWSWTSCSERWSLSPQSGWSPARRLQGRAADRSGASSPPPGRGSLLRSPRRRWGAAAGPPAHRSGSRGGASSQRIRRGSAEEAPSRFPPGRRLVCASPPGAG